MIGKLGDCLVELAACWALVTADCWTVPYGLRSIYGLGTLMRLWSNNKRGCSGVTCAVPGFYGVLLVAFSFLHGVACLGHETLGRNIRSSVEPISCTDVGQVPQSTVLSVHWISVCNERPWAVERLCRNPVPLDIHMGPSVAGSTTSVEGVFSGTTCEFRFRSCFGTAGKRCADWIGVSFPEDKTSVYTISISQRSHSGKWQCIDQYSGKVLADGGRITVGTPKAVEDCYMSKYFGLPNQLLMLFACLIVITL